MKIKNMKWISITEKLPSGFWCRHDSQNHLSEDVLICNSSDIFIGRWNRNELEWETDEPAARNTVYEVTHWMTLPEIPIKIITTIV